MKHVYLTVVSILFFILSFAAPTNTVVINNGSWNQQSTWSLGRQPVDGDTVTVPVNTTLVINNHVNAPSSNFYFKVYGTLKFQVGKLDIGENSVIILMNGGKIVSVNGNNSEYIKIGGQKKYSGQDGTINGPAVANSHTGVSPAGFSELGSISLPVTFLGFNVARSGNDVLVQWSTAQEINSSKFEVERSEDGANWNSVSTVTAAGNSSSIQTYSFTDRSVLSKTTYYRIKQVDIDGRFIYTAIRSIKNTTSNNEVKVAAVAQNKIVLQFNQQIKSAVSVRIISLSGQILAQQNLVQPVGQVLINTNNLKGNYIVSVTNGQDVNSNTQILF